MAILYKIHSSNWLYLVICVLGVAAFFLVGIYPNSVAMDELEETIAEHKTKIETQELLFPVFARLIKEVQQQGSTLAVPTVVPITRDDTTRIADVFGPLAAKNHVKLESVAPDTSSYLEDSGSLTINVAFSGDFFDFQKLLLDLCQLPYLTAINQVDLRSAHEEKKLMLKMQIKQEQK
jgi:hypothetical protein